LISTLLFRADPSDNGKLRKLNLLGGEFHVMWLNQKPENTVQPKKYPKHCKNTPKTQNY